MFYYVEISQIGFSAELCDFTNNFIMSTYFVMVEDPKLNWSTMCVALVSWMPWKNLYNIIVTNFLSLVVVWHGSYKLGLQKMTSILTLDY